MNIAPFTYFITIAEKGNLTWASEQLYVSQPTLSRFLSRLEKDLNVTLFIRAKNNSLVITEAGKLYLEFCRNTVVEYNNVVAKITREASGHNQVIRCGVTSEKAIEIITSFLPTFIMMHPTIKVDLVIKPADQLTQMLSDGTVDFVRSAYIEKDSAFHYVDVENYHLNLVVPLNHRFGQLSNTDNPYQLPDIHLNDLKDEPLVMLNNNTIQRKALQNYFQTNDFSPNVLVEVATGRSALAIVESGLAISLLPQGYQSELVCSLNIAPPIYLSTAIIYRKKDHLTSAASDFLKLFRKHHSSSD